MGAAISAGIRSERVSPAICLHRLAPGTVEHRLAEDDPLSEVDRGAKDVRQVGPQAGEAGQGDAGGRVELCDQVDVVAIAMAAGAGASHRLLLLSDGQANEGTTDRAELAHHTGELLKRGIITSAVGIGDGYDEELLGAMAEAGGGRLHDAGEAHEIGEVVLGELREGRDALLERATLRLTVPAT